MVRARVLLGVVSLAAWWVLSGCAASEPLPTDAPPAFASAERALVDLGFAIDRRDVRGGVLTTKPQVVPAWRDTAWGSPAPAGQVAQGLVTGLRRTVRVTWPEDGAGGATGGPAVEVRLLRPQDATVQLTHTSARQRFHRLDAVPGELAVRGVTARSERDLGRDAATEAVIREAIEREAG